MPIKDDWQAFACDNEYHDDERSLMPTQDTMSNDYALGTRRSKECMYPT